MPDFVSCPRCGCGVGVAAVLLTPAVRCIGCGHRFVPAPKPPETAPHHPTRRPVLEPEAREPNAAGPNEKVLCPVCGGPVGWRQQRCPYCREEFLDELPHDRVGGLLGPRRDCQAHQGPLIATLGKASLIAGILPLFTCGLASVVGLPLGLVTWVLAQSQLRRIEAGLVDVSGRAQVEFGREQAFVGVVLSTLFGIGFGLGWWYFH